MKFEMHPIGLIHSPYSEKEETPIQGTFRPGGQGRVEVFPEYVEGLKDVEGFSHLLLLYAFDRAGEIELVRPTFLDDLPHGLFASRHPARPNGIGLTIVELKRRDGAILHVRGVDTLDNTPLLDIKPYIPRFDSFPHARAGWTEGKRLRPKPTGRE